MLIEIIILLEIIAFVYLALGIIPHNKNDENAPPLMNRMIFMIVSMILFFSLAATTVEYDYTYCYINQTTPDYTTNQTISDATCDNYKMESIGLSYINWGMGFLATVLSIIIMLIIGFTNTGRKNFEE